MSQIIWTEQEVQALIDNRAEENIHLDFKAADALKKTGECRRELCKDVSAFANSDGGVIVYGLNEKKHVAESLSLIDGDDITKEWIEQVINGGIQRRIDGLKIHPVRFDKSIKKSVYVVEIPVSPLAPHMANNKYYKRFNFESVAMEEYEVRMTTERKKIVKLEIDQVSVRIPDIDKVHSSETLTAQVEVRLKNVGDNIADSYRIRCLLPNADVRKLKIINAKDYHLEAYNGVLHIFPRMPIPVYPGESIEVLTYTFPFNQGEMESVSKLEVHTELFTDSGKKKLGKTLGASIRGLIDKAKANRS